MTLLAMPAAAQEWSGSIGAGYLWQDSDGNEDAFRSQFNLQEGFVLEDLEVVFDDSHTGVTQFSLNAWGFGDASPTEAARLRLDLAAGFSFLVDYDKRASFFNLAGGDFAARRDDWNIERYRGALIIDRWRPVRLSLIYRSVETEGVARRPLYGLNAQYPIGVDLDQSMREATVVLETRSLPVRIQLEQSFADYEKTNRPFATGDEAVDGDPDELREISSTVVEEMTNVPTSRVIASYSSQRFEGAASLLWRTAELNVSGVENRTFGIGGGPTGTIQVIDDILSSADQDTLAGRLSLGFLVAPRWTLRLTGDYRDGSANSSLIGDRILRVISSLGEATDLNTSWNDNGLFDYTDSQARMTIEYRSRTWSAWAGGTASSRDVNWRLTDEADTLEVDRTSTGFVVGATWTPSRAIDLTFEYDRGDFDDFVFRLDPETVDRATLRFRSRLGRGWQLQAHGRYLNTTNPPEQADLDWRSTPFGAAITWTSNGGSTVGLDLEQYNFETDTLVVLPDGHTDRSLYDLDLMTATLFGSGRFGDFGVRGSITYLDDSGSTWPLDSLTGRLRFTMYGAGGLEYSAIAQYWSYNEGRANVDDFDIFRYGLAINWRFK